MIRIFYGDERTKIQDEVKKLFGENYEVVDGEGITTQDLPSIFKGTSLFGEKRQILIKDFGENKDAFEKLPDYLDTSHDVILFETKLDKRTITYKAIKDKIEIREFAAVKKDDYRNNPVFNIFSTAKRDGKAAVKMLEEIKDEQDPYMLVGLFVSQALKDFSYRQGTKEKRVLKELSKLDLKLKSSTMQPFSLIESFLLQVSSWQ